MQIQNVAEELVYTQSYIYVQVRLPGKIHITSLPLDIFNDIYKIVRHYYCIFTIKMHETRLFDLIYYRKQRKIFYSMHICVNLRQLNTRIYG